MRSYLPYSGTMLTPIALTVCTGCRHKMFQRGETDFEFMYPVDVKLTGKGEQIRNTTLQKKRIEELIFD